MVVKKYLTEEERLEARRKSGKKYRDANPGKFSSYNKEYHKTNHAKLCKASMLRNAKRRALEKGFDFSLTLEDIVIPEFCPVLGIPLEHGAYSGKDTSPALDRWDNGEGYTVRNVRVISQRANRIKNDATLEEILKIAAYMKCNQETGRLEELGPEDARIYETEGTKREDELW